MSRRAPASLLGLLCLGLAALSTTPAHAQCGPATCSATHAFIFASGLTVSCFSIRMLDYGDLFPYGGTTRTVALTGYDASNVIVSQDVLTSLRGVDLVAGDACASQGTDPGDRLFLVSGAGMVRVTLSFDAFPDPNVGFDDIVFCEHAEPTPTARHSWGGIKTRYRD